MSDDLIDVVLDSATLSDGDVVATLGDSALGHAVRRVLALRVDGPGSSLTDPIAAHDSHV